MVVIRHSSLSSTSRFARTRHKKNAQGMSFLPPLKLRLQLVARRGRGRAQQRNTDKPAPAVGGPINKPGSVGARGLSDSRAPPIHRATPGRASTACDRFVLPEEQQEPRLLWIGRGGGSQPVDERHRCPLDLQIKRSTKVTLLIYSRFINRKRYP